eukprot:1389619-Lingulodinium_polyedra.AAC.1
MGYQTLHTLKCGSISPTNALHNRSKHSGWTWGGAVEARPGRWAWGQGAVVWVCLLYTSPSPRDA